MSFAYEWNTTEDVLNNIKLKFFLQCFGYVFSAVAIVSLFPCTRVGFSLSLARSGDFCVSYCRGWSSRGPTPLGFGDSWFEHTPPQVRTWFAFPQMLYFGIRLEVCGLELSRQVFNFWRKNLELVEQLNSKGNRPSESVYLANFSGASELGKLYRRSGKCGI